MNKQQFEKLMVKYRAVKNGDIEKCGKRMNELWNWINQNYISKEQILNLECLKEEKITAELADEACKMEQESEGSVSAFEFIENEQKEMETRNQLRNQIKSEIEKI